MKDSKMIKSSQYRITMGKSCLTRLISSHDEITALAYKEVGTIYLEFSKVFEIVTHEISYAMEATDGTRGRQWTQTEAQEGLFEHQERLLYLEGG